MNNKRLFDLYPMINEVIDDYRLLRQNGKDREVAISQIKNDHLLELSDIDDAFAIKIGLAIALCKKDELTVNIRDDALNLLKNRLNSEILDPALASSFKMIEQTLLDPQRIGNASHYPVKKMYTPDWKIGDTFCHQLIHLPNRFLSYQGWYIIFRKVGEYEDRELRRCQLVYATLCPSSQLPTTTEELDKLGLIRMMPAPNGKWRYQCQIILKSKKDELFWNLNKIGSFPQAKQPDDGEVENPYLAMPLFGKLRKTDTIPIFEESICRAYQKYGIREQHTP